MRGNDRRTEIGIIVIGGDHRDSCTGNNGLSLRDLILTVLVGEVFSAEVTGPVGDVAVGGKCRLYRGMIGQLMRVGVDRNGDVGDVGPK